MKSASRILIIVGSVLSFLGAIGMIITAIVFFAMAAEGNREAIIQSIKDGSMTTSYTGTPEEMAVKIQALFGALAIVFIIIGAFYLITPIISLIASGNNSKGLHIAGLVLSVVGFDLLLILGNAFGLSTETK